MKSASKCFPHSLPHGNLHEMEKVLCETCRSNKTALRCGLCNEASCKTCAHVLGPDAFSFLPTVADDLKKGVYCHTCFVAKVESHATAYEKTMEAARNIDVFFSDQGKETRNIPRSQIKYKIDTCDDRDELVLRFAFRAALDGFNSIVDVDITPEKVRRDNYQTTNYRGTASPANAKKRHIPKDRSLKHNPN